MHDGSPLLKLETRLADEPANARSAPPSPGMLRVIPLFTVYRSAKEEEAGEVPRIRRMSPINHCVVRALARPINPIIPCRT
jgi:hypothetical protein